LVVLLVIMVLTVIAACGLYVIDKHKKVASLDAKTDQTSQAANLNASTPGEASTEGQINAPQAAATPTPTPQPNKSTSSTKSSGTAQSQPTAPSVSGTLKANGSITFSADGCHVTAIGTPGLLLSGLVQTANRHKGGPMGTSPDGVKIPASGTITELVAESIGGFDYSTYVVDATLTDSTGTTIASNSATITAHSCQ